MRQWPVVITEGRNVTNRGPSAPRENVEILRTKKAGETVGYWVVCPKCGFYGYCPLDPEEGWIAQEGADSLTLRPSIVCPCGGRYWLECSVLTEA